MKIIVRITTFCILLFTFFTVLLVQNYRSKRGLERLNERAEDYDVSDAEKIKIENDVQKSLLKFHINRANKIISQNYFLNDENIIEGSVKSVVGSNEGNRLQNSAELSKHNKEISVGLTEWKIEDDDNKKTLTQNRDNRFKLTRFSNEDNENRFDSTKLIDDVDNKKHLLKNPSNFENKKILDLLGTSNEDDDNFLDLIRLSRTSSAEKRNNLDVIELSKDDNENRIKKNFTFLSNDRYRNQIEELTILRDKVKKGIEVSRQLSSQENENHEELVKKESSYLEGLTYFMNKDNQYLIGSQERLPRIGNAKFQDKSILTGNLEKHLENSASLTKNTHNSQSIGTNHLKNYSFKQNNQDFKIGEMSLKEKMYPNFINCSTKNAVPGFVERGNFMVLENYIPATMTFQCNESITYATYGELENLHNLINITSRWKGPVSVAVYTIGKDFENSLKYILYLRNCISDDVRNYVTFHLFFDIGQFPDSIPISSNLSHYELKCEKSLFSDIKNSYRNQKELSYPVNVARNIASSHSATFFHFVADIDMLPSLDIIPEFLQMLNRPDISKTMKQRVYVIPVFEIQKDDFPPPTKLEMVEMLRDEKAFVPQEYFCRECHRIPNLNKWTSDVINPGVSVFSIEKLHEENSDWEPYFIGTKTDPILEERFYLEQKSNRITQAYVMCLLDYEFHILDNAFVTREAKIKSYNSIFNIRSDRERNIPPFLKIIEEYKSCYGAKPECRDPTYF